MRPYRQVVLLVLCCVAFGSYVRRGARGTGSAARNRRHATLILEYAWLAATRAVQLSGPGIVLVVRPGDNLYEVDDRVEVTAVTPRYISNDIYVSQEACHTHHPTSTASARTRLLRRKHEQRAEVNAEQQQSLARRNCAARSSSTSLQLKGAEAVLVTGDAPPTAPVRITLLATLSSDLPNVLLSRHDLTAGPDGKFQAIVPIAPDYMRDSFIHVLATSSPGVTSASAQLLVHGTKSRDQRPL